MKSASDRNARLSQARHHQWKRIFTETSGERDSSSAASSCTTAATGGRIADRSRSPNNDIHSSSYSTVITIHDTLAHTYYYYSLQHTPMKVQWSKGEKERKIKEKHKNYSTIMAMIITEQTSDQLDSVPSPT